MALPSAHEATALDHLAEYSPNATRLASEWHEHGDDAVHGLVWNGLGGTNLRSLSHKRWYTNPHQQLGEAVERKQERIGHSNHRIAGVLCAQDIVEGQARINRLARMLLLG